MESQFYLSPNIIVYKRVTYGLFSIFSELGGFIKIVQVIANILLRPIFQFLYFLAIIKSMYFASTDNDQFFSKNKHNSNKKELKHRQKYLDMSQFPEDLKVTDFKKEIRQHRQIQFSCKEKTFLFLHLIFPCIKSLNLWSK